MKGDSMADESNRLGGRRGRMIRRIIVAGVHGVLLSVGGWSAEVVMDFGFACFPPYYFHV
jgi:hypothetical protein